MTFCQSKGNIPYFETSAKEAVNVEQAFEGKLHIICLAWCAFEAYSKWYQSLHEVRSHRRKQRNLVANSVIRSTSIWTTNVMAVLVDTLPRCLLRSSDYSFTLPLIFLDLILAGGMHFLQVSAW